MVSSSSRFHFNPLLDTRIFNLSAVQQHIQKPTLSRNTFLDS